MLVRGVDYGIDHDAYQNAKFGDYRGVNHSDACRICGFYLCPFLICKNPKSLLYFWS